MAPGGPRAPTDAPRATGSRQRRRHPITFAGLVALGVVLPFEASLFRVGPLTITTVEVVLYGVIAAWAIGMLVSGAAFAAASDTRRWLGRPTNLGMAAEAVANRGADPIARAVLLGLAVSVISALAAPTGHRIPAMKFGLRAVSGVALFFAARDAIESPGDRRVVAGALVLGAALSALGAVFETAFPSTAGLWHPFRTTTFSVTGLPRPSGPFAYPTIAAMYWEAALPLAIGLPWAKRATATAPATPTAMGRRRRGSDAGWVGTVLAIALVALFVTVTLFSATRTALAIAPLSCAAVLVLTWRGSPRPARVATVGALVVIALLAVGTFAIPVAASPLAMRMRWWQDGTWYRVRYGVAPEPLTLPAGSTEEVALTVANEGGLVWPAAGLDAVHVSYHWERRDATGTHLDFDGWRSALPADVAPGQTVRVLATVQAPDTPGTYRLRWDVVREHVTWFSERGNPTLDQVVDVLPAPAAARSRRRRPAMVDASLEEWMATENPSRPQLWAAAMRLWWQHPLFGVGPDNFRHLYGQVMPVARPGARYDERTHANSLYFETLADLGVAGIAALALLMFTLGRLAWRAVRAAAASGVPCAPFEIAVAVALGTFFVHGLLDYFLPFTPAYGLYWTLLAISTGPSSGAVVHRGSADSTP